MATQTREEVLGQDFSSEFVELMKHRVVEGFQDWGSIHKYISEKETSVPHVLKRVEEHLLGFQETRKESHLADAANNIMFLFLRNRIRPESIRKD